MTATATASASTVSAGLAEDEDECGPQLITKLEVSSSSIGYIKDIATNILITATVEFECHV